MKLQRSIQRFVLIISVIASASCTDDYKNHSLTRPYAKDVEVQLLVPQTASRLCIDEDEGGTSSGQTLSLKWSDGDQFALWAYRAGTAVFSNITFTHNDNVNDPDGELFSAKIPRMAEGNDYTYRAVYPLPSALDGTDACFDIPAVQNGKYDGTLDIMSATGSSGTALTPKFYQEIGLNFRHETHALKITIPEGSNDFGYDITRIRIEFPQPVTGELRLNTLTGEADYSGISGNIVDIKFDTPVACGDAFWVFIAPADLSGEVSFTAYGGDEEIRQSEPSIAENGVFGNLQRSHITPVNLGIKESFSITWFEYEIADWSYLGENIESINIKLPAGLQLADRSQEQDNSKKIVPENDGIFRIAFRTDELQNALAGGIDLSPVFESEHAIVTPYSSDLNKLIISDGSFKADSRNEIKIDHVPYLFEEDFSGAGDNSYDDNYATSSTGNKSGHTLAGLSGWTGARVGTSAGESARLAPRYESVLGAATYPSRLDSAPLQNLKSTAAVTITFDYGMDARYGGIGGAVRQQTIQLGYVTASNTYGGGDSAGTFINTITMKEQGASWTNLPYTTSYSISEATNVTRLTWRAYTETPGGASNCTCWFYIDNVKVSITQ